MQRGTVGGIPTVIVAVVISTFFVGFGGGVIFPILPNLGVILGISPFMVAFILSANRITRLVANAPVGALVDRYGTRKLFVYGLFIQAVATFGYVLAVIMPDPDTLVWVSTNLPLLGPDHWFWIVEGIVAPETWFLIARVLWGIGSAAVMAPAYTIVADISPRSQRGTNMGIVRGGLLLGFPAGLVLGGVVSSVTNEAIAFGMATGFALLAGIFALFLVPETHVIEDAHRSVKPWEIETAIPAVTVGLVNFGIMFAFLGAYLATLVLFLEEQSIYILGLDAQGSSGILMAGTAFSSGVAMVIGGRISDTFDSRVPILIAFLLTSFVGFLLLPFSATLTWIVIASILIGVGQGGVSGPMMALLADLMPDERMGRASGTNNVLGDIGGALGPLVSLPLIEYVGFTPIYVACAFIPLLAGVVLVIGVRRETGTVVPDQNFAD